jgi:hypothetical protein
MTAQSSNNARAVSLFHPATDTWSTEPPMTVERTNHVALPMEGGALIAGGAIFGTQLDSAGFYREGRGWSARARWGLGERRDRYPTQL